MLPSTGYFKGINCPFFDNGLCERPYCHFRHAKKEYQNPSTDGVQSGAILQKIVSAAVQKVLQQTDSSVVLSEAASVDISSEVNKNNVQAAKATYNPTPISELNKICPTEINEEVNEQKRRHIPVPYTPRKPSSLPIKRTVDTNGSLTPLIYLTPPVKYKPGSADSQQLDPYTPKGGSDCEGKYLPGSEAERQEYQPDESQNVTSKHNYVPTDKTVSKKKILEYKPAKVSVPNEATPVTYQPTPRALVPCFSSDEDESNHKKRKLSGDLNELDDLGTEFDILSQILDEEKSELNSKTEAKSHVGSENKKHSKKKHKSSNDTIKDKLKDQTHNPAEANKKDKRERSNGSKKDKNKSKNDEKSDSKNNKDNEKHDSKTKEKHKDKQSRDKRRHSSTKSSRENSKSSIDKSSKSESESNHKKRSKSDSKDRSKNEHKRKHKSSKEHKDKSNHRKSKNKKQHVNNVSDSDLVGNESTEELCEFSESDEETRAEECKKIFEEYVPTEKCISIDENLTKIDDTADSEDYVPSKKRISRTAEKNIKVIPKAPIKPDFKFNAAQAMANRLAKVKEYHVSQSKIETTNDSLFKNIHSTSNAGTTKIRIAHVPYASTLMNAKKTVLPNIHEAKTLPSTSTTICQTIKKGEQRVAHIPNEKFIDRPGVLEPLGSKIPANVRSTYLNMMIDECLKIYLATTDAYARAQHEELSTSKKCSTVQIYKNSAVLTVSRLRKEIQECNGIKKSGTECTALQKIPLALSGNTSNAGSWSIENKNKRMADDSKEFSGTKLFSNIKKWILSEEQLQENGFPRPHPSGDKGRAIIYGQKKQFPPKGYVRTCCRCKKDYTVDKKGFASVKEECIYHPNNKYRVRGEARYQCCSQDGTSDGCCVAPSHVYEYVDYENLKGYIKTLSPERELEDYGVYSLDCEMCYTTHGLDLTRVTVINSDCKVIYETLIKPFYPIIDYNTRYSGITEEQMKGVRTTLLEVQATLLAMFNSKTILIGHSLESDFKALKLIHETVIDTSVLFPHKMGLPYKRALRNLSSEYLKKIIQNSVDGHDSAEDATVCMELILFKLKEDLKTR